MCCCCLWAVARTCGLIFIVLDCLKPLQHKRLLEHELEGFGIRLNKDPPNIVFKKKDKGGLNLQTMVSRVCFVYQGVGTVRVLCLAHTRTHNTHTHTHTHTLRAPLSGTFLQTLLSYTTEGALFISAQRSIDVVSAPRTFRVLI